MPVEGRLGRIEVMTKDGRTQIVFALDFSEMSDFVIQSAIQQAQAHPNPSLHAVCVIAPRRNLVSGEEHGLDHELSELEKVLRDRIEPVFRESGHPLDDGGWPVAIHTREGRPADEIAELSHEVGADLIVVGRHGHSGPHEFLIGTVPARLLLLARCSVLIVRPTDHAES
jgi:nucleotide-binding universal stress UspA family protein